MPEKILYGYSIYDHLEYRLSSRALINVHNGRFKRLGKTKARLLEYFFLNASKDVIHDRDIIIDVFEQYDLRCSKSYLSTMLKDIRLAFLNVGFERDLIVKKSRYSYSIDAGAVRTLYISH